MISEVYRRQVKLLLKILPHVAKEPVFALKGGTAINLFVQELPRLSVDIDLTYLPFEQRATSLMGITEGLKRIRDSVLSSIPSVQCTLRSQGNALESKLDCTLDGVHIKIEVNTIIRGYLQQPRMMQVVAKVQEEFGLFAAINVVSLGELYGGKICAALDRQHPRDLFDIHKLFENEGITEEIRLGFIAALLGHNRPIHELLFPNFQKQNEIFDNQFLGMTLHKFDYEAFEKTRERLVVELHSIITNDDRKLLLSFKSGNPDWDLYAIPGLENMPAVRWKLQNIKALLKNNPAKHTQQLEALRAGLDNLNSRSIQRFIS